MLWLCSSTLLAKTLVMPLEKMYQPLSMEHLQKIAQADTAMVVLGGGAVLAPDVQGEGTLAELLRTECLRQHVWAFYIGIDTHYFDRWYCLCRWSL